jgi:NAD(P)-dependent dehydrogenase (short-subunit alcohol dehydrogenase family)
MSRIFITGSADGLGQLAARALIEQGHELVLHARNEQRGRDALQRNPGAKAVLTGDLSDLEQTKALARKLNEWGRFDAIIHNAGVYQNSAKEIFAVNTCAPYILTCLVQKPDRLIYMSSAMHLSGHPKLEFLKNNVSRINYSDSKLHVLMLALTIARKWRDVYSNAVNPGWVPTRMGGAGAPDDLKKGYETQVWLATSNEGKARVSGRYFFHQKEKAHNSEADDVEVQDSFLKICGEITGVSFPE